jgi:hypothetical protein
MDQAAQVRHGSHQFVACVAAVAAAEAILATTCAALLRDWTLLLTGVLRLGILFVVARWAASGRPWGQVALAAWGVAQMAFCALGAGLAAFAPDLLLRWVPHTEAVRGVPPYWWAFPTARLAVFLLAGIGVFRSPEVAAFWAERRGRPFTAMSPVAWLCLAAAVLSLAVWAIATGLAEPAA